MDNSPDKEGQDAPIQLHTLADEYEGPVLVTVTHPDTGEVLKEQIVSDDYMLICNGNRYVKSFQTFGRTHQVNIAYAPPDKR